MTTTAVMGSMSSSTASGWMVTMEVLVTSESILFVRFEVVGMNGIVTFCGLATWTGLAKMMKA